jgi:hypothetical protein
VRSLLIGRMAAMFFAAGSLLVLGVGAGPAQAAPKSPVGTDSACPTSASVCIYKKTHYKGTEHTFKTSTFKDTWTNLKNYDVFPWGSLKDNSGSSVYFYNKSAKHESCFKKHSRSPNPGKVVRHSRYMYIRYGSNSCSHITPP